MTFFMTHGGTFYILTSCAACSNSSNLVRSPRFRLASRVRSRNLSLIRCNQTAGHAESSNLSSTCSYTTKFSKGISSCSGSANGLPSCVGRFSRTSIYYFTNLLVQVCHFSFLFIGYKGINVCF